MVASRFCRILCKFWAVRKNTCNWLKTSFPFRTKRSWLPFHSSQWVRFSLLGARISALRPQHVCCRKPWPYSWHRGDLENWAFVTTRQELPIFLCSLVPEELSTFRLFMDWLLYHRRRWIHSVSWPNTSQHPMSPWWFTSRLQSLRDARNFLTVAGDVFL